MSRRRLAPLLLAVLAVAGCGDEGLDFSRRTPPPYIGGDPIAPAGQRLVSRQMTPDDAERLKPVIADWADAVRAGDIDRASGFFTLPSIVYQAGSGALQMNSERVAAAFNASLPCGARLISTDPDGRYVVGTFLLSDVGVAECPNKGELAKVGFVFGDRDHPQQFSEWWQLSTERDAKPGPEVRPTTVVPATVGSFG